jgi:hypothetical protein
LWLRQRHFGVGPSAADSKPQLHQLPPIHDVSITTDASSSSSSSVATMLAERLRNHQRHIMTDFPDLLFPLLPDHRTSYTNDDSNNTTNTTSTAAAGTT